MSVITGRWVMTNVREYLAPYEKRTFATASTQLGALGWAKWAADRVDAIESGYSNGCRIVVQFQPFGGAASQFRSYGDSGETSYSWRDTVRRQSGWLVRAVRLRVRDTTIARF